MVGLATIRPRRKTKRVKEKVGRELGREKDCFLSPFEGHLPIVKHALMFAFINENWFISLNIVFFPFLLSLPLFPARMISCSC